jgi:tripartite ATP-independent transporter DctM subunit
MSAAMLMLWGLVIILMIGIPAAISMGLAGTFYFAVTRGIADLPLELIASRVVYGIDSFPLMAVPLFLFVGHLMNESGATTRIFYFADAIVGHVRGGLGYVNVIGSMIFAGMCGSGTADAAGLGAIEIKAMRDAGYDDKFTIGVTVGSALIGPIIPPSIPAILFAILADVSASKILIAGFIPGVLMGLAMMVLVFYYAWRNKYPKRAFSGFREVYRTLLHAFLSLMTPVILIGGIVFGFFTATEAAAIAGCWAIVVACFAYRTVGLAKFVEILRRSTVDSAIIMFILACSALFGWILTRAKMPEYIAEWIMTLTHDPVIVMALIIVFLLFIGCFVAVAVAINVLTPILVPLAVALGFDPVHFGVIMIMTLVIGEATPPFGMVLYVLARVTGRPFSFIVNSSLSWLLVILGVVVLVAVFPGLALWLPNSTLLK